MQTRYLVLTLALAGMGCTSMQVVQPAEVIPSQHPPYVWLQKANGEIVDVLNPAIVGDHLTGTTSQLGEHFDVPLKDITWVKAREHDKTRTLAATVGGVAVGSVILVELATQGGASVPQPCSMVASQNHQC